VYQGQGRELRKDGAAAQQEQSAQVRMTGLGGKQGGIHEVGFYRSHPAQGVRQYVAGF
jgi:hypothetical protein